MEAISSCSPVSLPLSLALPVFASAPLSPDVLASSSSSSQRRGEARSLPRSRPLVFIYRKQKIKERTFA